MMAKYSHITAILGIVLSFAAHSAAGLTFNNFEAPTSSPGVGNYQPTSITIDPESSGLPYGTVLRLKSISFLQESGYASNKSVEFLTVDGVQSDSRVCDVENLWEECPIAGNKLTYTFDANVVKIISGVTSTMGYKQGTGSYTYLRIKLFQTTATKYGYILLHSSMNQYRPVYEIEVETMTGYTRSLNGGSESWTQSEAWDFGGIKKSCPDVDSDITLYATNTTEGCALVLQDYDTSVAQITTCQIVGDTNHTVTIGGAGTLTVTKSLMTSANLTIEYGAADITSAALDLQDGATLTFDIRGKDFSPVYQETSIQLTGKVTRDDAHVKLIDEAGDHPGYTAELVYMSNAYYLKLKVARKAMTLYWCQGTSNDWTRTTEWYSPLSNRNYTVINGDTLVIDKQAIVVPFKGDIPMTIAELRVENDEDEIVTIAGGIPAVGKFTKLGAGKLYLNGDNTSFVGGFTADGGTVVMGHKNALGNLSATRSILFTNGAKLDENGVVNGPVASANFCLTLNGGVLTSSVTGPTDKKAFAVNQMILTGNGEINAEDNTEVGLTMQYHTSANIKLNNYTLTKTGVGDAYLSCPTFEGDGTFKVSEGKVRLFRQTRSDYNTTAANPRCLNGTVEIDKGGEIQFNNYGATTIMGPDSFTVKNLIINGEAKRGAEVTNGVYIVTGSIGGTGSADYLQIGSGASFDTSLGAVTVTRELEASSGFKVIFKDLSVRVAEVVKLGESCVTDDFNTVDVTYETKDGEAITDATMKKVGNDWYAVRKGTYLRIR